NVQAHGTGALNIDGCRVGTEVETWPKSRAWGAGYVPGGDRSKDRTEPTGDAPPGRWPSNLVLTHAAACGDECSEGCPVAELDRQSGTSTTHRIESSCRVQEGKGWSRTLENRGPRGFSDSGGASRFFPVTEWDAPFLYVAKPDKAERAAGLDGNHHPTVKPLDLMRWLVRLVTPPGGTVLDPFAGSGTTLAAGLLEGFDVVGVELTDEYLPLVEGRCRWAEREARFGPVQGPTKVRKDAGAPTLFDDGGEA
ncbi:MAG: DNA methyltransferase, partial [Actinomycetes bacterium]